MNAPEQIIQYFLLHPLALLALIIWTFLWKGISLWMSARRDQRNWFVAILILNTLGILEIIYILYTTNKEKNEVFEETETEKKDDQIS